MALGIFGPSTAATHALVNSRLSLLPSLLPPTASIAVPTATRALQPLSILPNTGDGQSVLVLNHKDLDPRLTGWLADVQKRFGGLTGPQERSEAVFRHVVKTFAASHRPLFHPLAWLKERSLKREPLIPLGLNLAYGIGACLPQAAALHLAFQEASLPSNILMGDLSETCLEEEIAGESLANARHAWVEAEIEGRRTLFDTTQVLSFPFPFRDFNRPRRTGRKHRGIGQTSVAYIPAVGSRILGTQVPLSKAYFLHEQPFLRGALELYARALG